MVLSILGNASKLSLNVGMSQTALTGFLEVNKVTFVGHVSTLGFSASITERVKINRGVVKNIEG